MTSRKEEKRMRTSSNTPKQNGESLVSVSSVGLLEAEDGVLSALAIVGIEDGDCAACGVTEASASVI